jgi:hypothetical protein
MHYRLNDRGSIPGRRRGYTLRSATAGSKPALRPIQPPVQWVPGALGSFPEGKGAGA